MSTKLAYIGAGATATAYAAALATPRGRHFRRDYTWLSVIVGVAATLGWLALADKRAAHKALSMFAITGTPIVLLCLGEDMDRDEQFMEYLKRR